MNKKCAWSGCGKDLDSATHRVCHGNDCICHGSRNILRCHVFRTADISSPFLAVVPGHLVLNRDPLHDTDWSTYLPTSGLPKSKNNDFRTGDVWAFSDPSNMVVEIDAVSSNIEYTVLAGTDLGGPRFGRGSHMSEYGILIARGGEIISVTKAKPTPKFKPGDVVTVTDKKCWTYGKSGTIKKDGAGARYLNDQVAPFRYIVDFGFPRCDVVHIESELSPGYIPLLAVPGRNLNLLADLGPIAQEGLAQTVCQTRDVAERLYPCRHDLQNRAIAEAVVGRLAQLLGGK